MLRRSEGRFTARTSRIAVWSALALAAACGGTSRNESDGPPAGHAGKSSAGAGASGGSGATGGAAQGATGGSANAGRGGAAAGGDVGSGTGGDAARAGTGAEGGGGGSDAGRGAEGGEAGTGGGSGGGSATGGSATGGSATGGAGSGAGGQSGAGTGGTGGMQALGAVAPAVQAYCAAVSSCCMTGDSLDTCESSYMLNSSNFTSLAAGLVTVDPDVLAQCQAAYAGADQCDLNTVVAACQGLFKGTRAVNESCTQGYDCDRSQGEMTCVIAGDCNVSPMGVCTLVPHAEAGETCLGTCESGEDCSSTTCGVGDTNALCFEDDGVYCAYFESGAICKAITPLGSTCSSEGSPECGSEAYCDVTCKALSKLGEPCGYGCRHELQCGDDETCHDPVWPVGSDDVYSCTGYAPGL